MVNQLWYCTCCNVRSYISFHENQDFMTVNRWLEESHKRVSPDCPDPSAQKILDERTADAGVRNRIMAIPFKADPMY